MGANKYKKVSDSVRDLYLEGYTKNAISEALGLSINQVGYILYTILKVHAKAPRKMSSINLVESMPKNLVNRVITLASWGYNIKEISEDTRLPYNRVHVLVKEATNKELIKKMV
jgi:hypothetical protein